MFRGGWLWLAAYVAMFAIVEGLFVAYLVLQVTE